MPRAIKKKTPVTKIATDHRIQAVDAHDRYDR